MKKLSVSNFKKFDDFDIPISNNHLVISGANNSGKTQVLWAFLLFFRGFDLKKNSVNVGPEIGKLLNVPALSHLREYSSFHPNEQSAGETILKGSFEDDRNDCGVVVKSSGIMEVRSNGGERDKLSYAFMGGHYDFVPVDAELLFVEGTTPLNSNSNCCRQLFSKLSDIAKDEICQFAGDLFRLSISHDLRITSESTAMDIMFSGAALQKVVCALTLLFTVISRQSPLKCYLMEEAETLLCPAIRGPFFDKIRALTTMNGVTFVVTSNSSDIIDRCCPNSRLALVGSSAGTEEEETRSRTRKDF